ncbi:hypothetical protein GBA52_009547 [Prunus armeniaca]|nr:hypothetical protein GBA52_009547 [Prunus armeniaca]
MALRHCSHGTTPRAPAISFRLFLFLFRFFSPPWFGSMAATKFEISDWRGNQERKE